MSINQGVLAGDYLAEVEKENLTMTSMFGRAALFGSLVGLSTPVATADVITPDSIIYTHNFDENDEAKLCEIILGVESPVPPEFVEFTAFAAYGKSDNSFAVGFITMAAKQVSSDELALVQVFDATFTSQTFQSAEDMDYEVYMDGDGGFMVATLDGTVASNFLRAFAGGNFELTLTTSEPESTTLTYTVSTGPSAEVQDSFAECLGQLVTLSSSGEYKRALLRQACRINPTKAGGRGPVLLNHIRHPSVAPFPGAT